MSRIHFVKSALIGCFLGLFISGSAQAYEECHVIPGHHHHGRWIPPQRVCHHHHHHHHHKSGHWICQKYGHHGKCKHWEWIPNGRRPAH